MRVSLTEKCLEQENVTHRSYQKEQAIKIKAPNSSLEKLPSFTIGFEGVLPDKGCEGKAGKW